MKMMLGAGHREFPQSIDLGSAVCRDELSLPPSQG